MNLLETQLRSWQPRQPSANLKDRIFLASPETPRMLFWSLRCLAPAAACLLVAMMALKPGGGISIGTYSHDVTMGMIGSNQIAYLPGNFQQEQNRLSHVTFEWTNLSGSTSSIGSFSPGKVN